MTIATIDFETQAIERRPEYPPKPVGCALRVPGRKPRYLAWGHPEENNVEFEVARRELRDVSKHHVIRMWNGKFDEDVGEVHLGMKFPHGIEDPYFLAFLNNPYAANHQLKYQAEIVCGIKPEERDLVRAYLFEFVPEAKRKKKNWGAYIARAPGAIVGPYAIGDVTRTDAVFDKLMPSIIKRGMRAAYERELALLPIVLANEREGMRVNLRKLVADLADAETDLRSANKWICDELDEPDLNIDSNNDLADALERAGKVKRWIATATDERSVSKENLLEVIEDRELAQVLVYRGKLAYVIRSFMCPWAEQADKTGGMVHTQWNQVRGTDERGGGGFGARTARLSSSPNFQNIPKEPVWLVRTGVTFDDGEFIQLPYTLLRKLRVVDKKKRPMLPYLRNYIVPDDKESVIIDRDYNQQELRVLAHFEGDRLLREYNEHPLMDVHARTQQLIKERTGLELKRRAVKIIGFGILYGMGLDKLGKSLGVDKDTARELKRAYLDVYPGIKHLDMNIKHRGEITTWGGRVYPTEIIEGSDRDLRYKLLNYLIQGSSADCTKQAMINYHHHPKRRGRLLLSVHDELVISVPKKLAKGESTVLEEAMQSVKFKVPMLSDAKTGATWASAV